MRIIMIATLLLAGCQGVQAVREAAERRPAS